MSHAQAFARDGYLLLKNLLPAARLEPVRAALDARVAVIRAELLAEGIELPPPTTDFRQNLMPLGEHLARYGRGWTEAMASSAVYQLYQAPELLDVLQELIGPQICGHKQFNLRPKLPGQELTTVPWHQDSGYYDPRLKNDTVLIVGLCTAVGRARWAGRTTVRMGSVVSGPSGLIRKRHISQEKMRR